MNNKFFSINLNFDSLGEAYGWPKSFIDDKTFTNGLTRILDISKKYEIPISFFIIGKDLENKKNFEIIKMLSDNELIEIGNHSYSHLFNFGSASEKIVYDEIYKSHEIIYKCTGYEPKGFIAPTWSISKNVIKSLINLNYEYDTSFFQSIVLYPAVLKIFTSHLLKRKYLKAFQILNRRDYLNLFKFNSEPFYLDSDMRQVSEKNQNSILEFPMPTINWLKPPIWHTTGYMLGWDFLKKNLIKILNKKKPFFYLIHPADILDNNDLDSRFLNALERMGSITFKKKIEYLEMVLDLIISNGYKCIKLIDLAKHLNDENNRN